MNCTTHSLCVVRSVKLHRKSFGTENMYLFRQVSRLCVIPLSRVCVALLQSFFKVKMQMQSV